MSCCLNCVHMCFIYYIFLKHVKVFHKFTITGTLFYSCIEFSVHSRNDLTSNPHFENIICFDAIPLVYFIFLFCFLRNVCHLWDIKAGPTTENLSSSQILLIKFIVKSYEDWCWLFFEAKICFIGNIFFLFKLIDYYSYLHT